MICRCCCCRRSIYSYTFQVVDCLSLVCFFFFTFSFFWLKLLLSAKIRSSLFNISLQIIFRKRRRQQHRCKKTIRKIEYSESDKETERMLVYDCFCWWKHLFVSHSQVCVVNMLAPNSGIFTFMANDVLILQNVNQFAHSHTRFLSLAPSLSSFSFYCFLIRALYLNLSILVITRFRLHFRQHCSHWIELILRYRLQNSRSRSKPRSSRLRVREAFVQIFMWKECAKNLSKFK